MTNRNSTLDNAKAFAIFVVVLAHVLRNGRYFTYFVPAAVPVFFMLSGFTYRNGISFLSFLEKKFRTIVVPYLFAGIISILIFSFLGKFASKTLGEGISTTDILPNIGYMLYGSGKNDHMKWNNSLWFLPCLFVVMLLVYFIETIVSIAKQNQFHRLILRLILCLLCLTVGLYITRKHGNIALPWHIETALCNVIFVEIGLIIAPRVKSIDVVSKNSAVKKWAYLIIFSIFAIAFAYFNGETSARTDEYGRSFILYFLSALCFALAYLYAGSLIGNSISAVSYVGMNTLPILMWNKYPVILLQTVIGKFTKILAAPSSPTALISAVIPALIAIMICLIAGKVQLLILPITLGRKPASKQ
ncbi:Fucose 4-O-acetylase [Butyrivibrio fibrisolvens DSM 3071]|uniref:Fucose 4-O-acetylase n=1 Tax=Butyrivibrio fibrisolvens DSM 3071 TaxID=1121131 RepID=A0A1M5Z1P2_BUTFI|nr:acyltransferase [Butyrivibrio fibrisolvens]SHI17823.1 Fucose 4-O-acetylase [Butyrivibrio fibrisolvens DSM 3071]